MEGGFKKTAKQVEATLILARYLFALLFGGSRSGKTFLIVRAIVLRALAKPSKHLIVRLRFNHVINSIWFGTFPVVMKKCFPGVEFKEDKQHWFIKFQNGSEIWFSGIDSKERMEKILGTEFSTIYANESSMMGWDAVSILKTRLSENAGLPLRFFFDCNPPSKKHWSYKVFVLGKEPTSDEDIDKSLYGCIMMNPADNKENLPPGYIEQTLASMPKRQRERFLEGLFTSDVDGALWTMELLDGCESRHERFEELKEDVGVRRVIIGVDPAITAKSESNLTGIIIVAVGEDGNYYVVDDESGVYTPDEWASKIIYAYKYYMANAIVVEVNQGGDMVQSILRLKKFYGKVIEVRAMHSKHARAEPVEALYEQGKVFHLKNPKLKHLEDELLTYIPNQSKCSPDRLDALVWALTLFVDKKDIVTQLKNTDFKAIHNRLRMG